MRRALTLLLILVASNSCRDPRAEANIAEAMMNVGTSINQMQQDLGELHNRIDSLREVAAYQDTVIRQLANLAGLPVRSR
jgi:transposase